MSFQDLECCKLIQHILFYMHVFKNVTKGHSLRLNAELAARVWVLLGSLNAGVNIILRSLIHDLYAPFIKLTKKNWENS